MPITDPVQSPALHDGDEPVYVSQDNVNALPDVVKKTLASFWKNHPAYCQNPTPASVPWHDYPEPLRPLIKFALKVFVMMFKSQMGFVYNTYSDLNSMPSTLAVDVETQFVTNTGPMGLAAVTKRIADPAPIRIWSDLYTSHP